MYLISFAYFMLMLLMNGHFPIKLPLSFCVTCTCFHFFLDDGRDAFFEDQIIIALVVVNENFNSVLRL